MQLKAQKDVSLSLSSESFSEISCISFAASFLDWLRGGGRAILSVSELSGKMDGDSDSSPKAALLGGAVKRGGSGRRGRLSRRYSVNSLRSEFISRLPEKVRSPLQDVESPYEIDLSQSTGFSRGSSFFSSCLSVSISVAFCCSISVWLLRD